MRWRVAKALFFSAAIAGYSAGALLLAPNQAAMDSQALIALGTALFSMVFTLITLSRFRRYPMVSFGRTSIFFYLAYAGLISLVVRSISLSVLWPLAFLSICFGVIMLLLWSGIVRFVRRKRYLIVPGGSAADLVASIDQRVDFVMMKQPDLSNIKAYEIDGVVLDTSVEPLRQWLDFTADAQLKRIPAYAVHELVERYSGRIVLSHVGEAMVTQLQPSTIYRYIKRFVDIVIVVTSCPLVVLAVAVIGVLIRLESPGSIIFRQKRIGESGKPYTIYKFRSMTIDAEDEGPAFAVKDDVRVTRIGRLIRKMRLDELPQFLNIFKGEMSLIGPRPEQERFVSQYHRTIPYYSYRQMVKPGITGWAQVTHGYTADRDSTEVKVEHDLYYIKHLSIWLDLLIALKTLRTVLTGFGAR